MARTRAQRNPRELWTEFNKIRSSKTHSTHSTHSNVWMM